MDNTVSENNNSQHRSTERVVLILEFLTETENSGKTLTEIANYLNAPKSSILPILRTLVSYGYLHYNPIVMQYFLGYKLYEIGTKYVGDSNMDDVIFQIMYNFASANDVTLIMGELIAGDVLVVQRSTPLKSCACTELSAAASPLMRMPPVRFSSLRRAMRTSCASTPRGSPRSRRRLSRTPPCFSRASTQHARPVLPSRMRNRRCMSAPSPCRSRSTM